MKKRLLILLSLVLTLSVVCFTFTACKDKDDNGNETPPHTHSFSTTYAYDATHHWYPATCEHVNEVKDKAQHSYNGICFCGAINPNYVSRGLEFTLSEDESYYTLTGIGICPDTVIGIPSSYKGKPVKAIDEGVFKDCDYIIAVYIPDSVTSIGWGVFRNCTSLTSVVIPDSVTSIGYEAFYKCTSLTSVVIPNSVTSIGWGVFRNCTSLTSVVIPDSVTSIGYEAFSNCDSLTSVVIPNSVTSIGYKTFYECDSLTSVVIPNSVTSIGYKTFYECDSLTIYCEASTKPGGWSTDWNNTSCPVVWDCNNNDVADNGSIYTVVDGVRYAIKDNVATVVRQPQNIATAIIRSSITYKNINYSVTSVYYSAFSDCTSLKEVVIPNSVTSIGNGAFQGCYSLTEVVIPNSVTSIGNESFSNCSRLTIYCEASSKPDGWNTYWERCPVVWDCNNNDVATDGYIYTVVDGIRYAIKDNVATIVKQARNITSEIIPSSITYKNNSYNVTSIVEDAFSWCHSLTSIVIPNSVTSIGATAFSGDSLTSITVDEDNQYYKSIDGNLYSKDGTILIQYAIGKTATTFTIPDSVTSIGYEAFYYCTSLTSVVIPDSVTSIGSYAFFHCYSLTYNIKDNVKYLGNNDNPYHAAIDSYNTIETITIDNNCKVIADYAFSYLDSLTEVVIPDSVTSIGEYAFGNCDSLTNITVDEDNQYYKSIDGNLYSKDGTTLIQYALGKTATTFTIPDSVTSIGDRAFSDCYRLTSVVIPDSVTSIGIRAFEYCDSLTNITVDEDNQYYKSIDGNLYSKDGITLIQYAIGKTATTFTIPDSVTSIGAYAFSDCDSLTSVVIGDSVTSIGNYAFYGCDSLTSVVIPNSVTSIGDDAFNWCTSLTDVYFTGSEEEWAEIEIGLGNVDLINATIHYNYVPED